MKTTGERVRIFRQKRGYTLKDLQSRTGIGIGHLSDIERNLVPVTARTAIKLARVMGLKNWAVLVEHGGGV